MLNVTFHGVRGSTPCSDDGLRRYGGHTSCVVLEAPGEAPIVCDLGTGLRRWMRELPASDRPLHATALLTHLHWDHVQGLPFFEPLFDPRSSLTIHAPVEDGVRLADAVGAFLGPPYFPVHTGELGGQVDFVEISDGDFVIGDAKVRSRSVPHPGPTNGYRVEWHGHVVAYLPDHQQPIDGSFSVADSVLELAADADVLIHDAQYTPAEFATRSPWGHSTYDYAYEVARRAGARRLVLFHHDPGRTDDQLDDLTRPLQDRAAGDGIAEVITAFEGLTISLDH